MSTRIVRHFIAAAAHDSLVGKKMPALARLTRDSVRQLVDPTDRTVCERLAQAFGRPVPGAAEGWAYFQLGPYYLRSPWRDYGRRAEWTSRGEFVPLVVLGPDMALVGVYGM